MLDGISYTELIINSGLSALVGLCVGIAVVVGLSKSKVLKRVNPVYNGFVKLYFLYIPIMFMLAAGTWQGITSTKASLLQELETNRPKIVEGSVIITKILWGKVERAFPDDKPVSVKDVIHIFSYKYLKENGILDSLDNSALAKIPYAKSIIEYLTSSFTATIFLEEIEKQLLAYVGENQFVDKKTLHTFFTADLIDAMRKGLFMDLLSNPVHLAFKPFFSFLNVILVLTAIPFLETIIYRMRSRKLATVQA